MTHEQLAALGGLAIAGTAMAGLALAAPAAGPLVWYDLRWPRDIDPEGVVGLLRSLAGDRRSPLIIFETVAHNHQLSHRVGVEHRDATHVLATFRSFLPGVHTSVVADSIERAPTTAWHLRVDTHQRPLSTDDPDQTVRALVTALASAGSHETIVLQWLLGRRLSPMHVPAKDMLQPLDNRQRVIAAVLTGRREMDGQARRHLRDKVGEPGFLTSCRIGVAAPSRAAAQATATRVLAALRTAEGQGVRLSWKGIDPASVASATPPRRWKLALNVHELVPLLGWPLGSDGLPGIGRVRARTMPPAPGALTKGRILGDATYPGAERPLALAPQDALQHVHVLGPTGTGKSTLLLNSALQEIEAGHAVVVIDPKGDLIEDLLARIPDKRRDDVVVLDPSDEKRPVGLNPLRCTPADAELVADQILSVFHALYRENWGPRTQDILHASLLTLAGRPDTTLCSVPVLLSNPTYRRRIVAGLTDEIALKPFWAWFENLTEAERQQAIAPVMNKLRAFLLRPRMRAVIGQATPKFDIQGVFTKRRILLVSLAKGQLGPEAAALLGSLVVSQLWQTTLRRVAIPAERRHPVMVFIDEFQDYLHLPTDLSDVLTQARGLGVSLTLAHQHFAQLPPTIRSAVLANARTRVCFQLGSEDAMLLARTSRELEAIDFQELGPYEAYVSLAVGGNVAPYTSIRTRPAPKRRQSPNDLRATSRAAYGTDLQDVEASLAQLVNGTNNDADERPAGRRRRA